MDRLRHTIQGFATLWGILPFLRRRAPWPSHHTGQLGEIAARNFLKKKGLKFLVANFSTPSGEIDLVFRDGDCLVFVEVKTRSSEDWTRPSRAVDQRKQLAMRRTAEAYLRLLPNPEVKYRFDIVEVLVDSEKIREIRHLEDTFSQTRWRRKQPRV